MPKPWSCLPRRSPSLAAAPTLASKALILCLDHTGQSNNPHYPKNLQKLKCTNPKSHNPQLMKRTAQTRGSANSTLPWQ